jgi:oxygen-independent coproporphyrinogen-3 oxidase
VDRFADYRIAGITRLSIGVQSFNQAQLQAIGRIHNDKQAIDAVKFARLAGFEQINLDLMYGLPDQTRYQAMVDLGMAINQGTPHLSWYQLTIEPNTVYYKRPPKLPSEEKIWDIQESGHEALAQAGYDHYEISAYARDSMYCRHNMNYWHFGDYLGIGAGAHSKITNTSNNSITRYSRYKNPDSYMQLTGSDGAATSHWELSYEDVILEFMMNALRLTGGFEIQAFEDMTGLPYSSLSGQLEIARKKSLLEISSNKIIPTRKGHNYLNDLLHCFMPS